MANPQADIHDSHTSPKMYIIGYILSLVLTIVAFWLVFSHVIPSLGGLITTILILAALQIVVQLFFFMHITEGEGPRYNVMVLILGLIFVAVVVGGSIWIMSFNYQVS